ncbi:MAG: NADH-quinone oxidoreductase subunit D [Bacillota bacterium]|nr:NADH-quinone oxidoreductase subunit D [Bacillota bacterium]
MTPAATRDAGAKREALAGAFPGLAAAEEHGVLVVDAPPGQAQDVLGYLKEAWGLNQLTDLTAVDYPERRSFAVVYRLSRVPEYDTAVVKVSLPRAHPELPSAAGRWANADWLEREVFDLFGVNFPGHPHLRRILTWEGFPGHPLRKDWEVAAELSEGIEEREEELTINVGPQHPSTHGVFRFKVRLDGETIVELDPVIGYVHRGMEKLLESRAWHQIIPYTDRFDYLASMFNNQAYVMAVERLAGIEVPERAEYLRVIACELNRIASHLVAIGAYGLDVGALTPILYTFREREKIYDLMEMLCGARMLYSYFRIGGLGYDVPEAFWDRLPAFLAEMPRRIDEYEELLTGNEIFLARTRGVGVLTGGHAIDHGVTGPNLRASGVPYDLRRADPYSLYSAFDFEVVTGERGDSYERYLVRVREMRESLKILEQAARACPREGPVLAKVPKILKPPPGEVYAHVESPRGEVGCYLVSDGRPQPYRFRWRSPSFNHLSVLRELVKGAKVADLIAVFGSIDVIGAEVDR